MNTLRVTEISTTSTPIIDLPWLYRIIDLQKSALPQGGFKFRAQLFHEKASIAVTWVNSKPDERLTAGSLVTPRWTSKAVCTQGQTVINRLLPVTSPGLVNLFETVPHEWVSERTLIREIRQLTESLPDHYIKLLNGIFWDYKRFYRFVIGPSSLNGHHNEKHGNLRHTIEAVSYTHLDVYKRQTVWSQGLCHKWLVS